MSRVCKILLIIVAVGSIIMGALFLLSGFDGKSKLSGINSLASTYGYGSDMKTINMGIFSLLFAGFVMAIGAIAAIVGASKKNWIISAVTGFLYLAAGIFTAVLGSKLKGMSDIALASKFCFAFLAILGVLSLGIFLSKDKN